MDVSLVVCTRDRAPQLHLHLQALKAIDDTDVDWELIVVDNGSSDHTQEVLRDFRRQFGGNLILIREERRGVSRARNAGILVASGDVIAFTDDDCYPEPNYLHEIVQPFRQPEIGYVGGRVTLFDPLDAPMTIKLDTVAFEIPPLSYVEAGVLHGANLAFRRAAIIALRGFDERLGPGTRLISGEDIDLIARASAAGLRGAYSPGASVSHHHRRRTSQAVRNLARGYDRGRGAYTAKMVILSNLKALYARHWYWRLRQFVLNGRLGAVSREIVGAVMYVAAMLIYPSSIDPRTP